MVYRHGQQYSPHIILMLRYVHGAYSFAEACMHLQSVFEELIGCMSIYSYYSYDVHVLGNECHYELQNVSAMFRVH